MSIIQILSYTHLPNIGNGMRNIEIQRQNSRNPSAKSDAFYRIAEITWCVGTENLREFRPTWRHGGCSNMNASNVFFGKHMEKQNLMETMGLYGSLICFMCLKSLEDVGTTQPSSWVMCHCALFFEGCQAAKLFSSVALLGVCEFNGHFFFLQEPIFMKYSLRWL